MVNRKILQAIKIAVRPIVRSFAEDIDFSMGDDAPPTSRAAALRAARTKILAAAAAVGTAAGTAASGPYGAAAGAALVPTAVDMVIDEIARELEGKKAAPADAATTTAAAISAGAGQAAPGAGLMSSKILGIPAPLALAGAGVAAFLLLRKKG